MAAGLDPALGAGAALEGALHRASTRLGPVSHLLGACLDGAAEVLEGVGRGQGRREEERGGAGKRQRERERSLHGDHGDRILAGAAAARYGEAEGAGGASGAALPAIARSTAPR